MGEEQSLDDVQEVLIGKGLGGALRYLRERGDLKETAVEWGGRSGDKKKKSKLVNVGIVDESNNNVVGKRDILLDRVDEFGRTMSPKEAFRQFSHKFHGKEPGKKKQAKRQKQFQEELQAQKQMNTSDTATGTSLITSMDKIRDFQAKLQSPYLVLTGHDVVKPGQTQTSDPRTTGSASTAKKEPKIGTSTSLNNTPILGDDNQTRDLLRGIKRREPEISGSKHPHPPAPSNKKPNAGIVKFTIKRSTA